MLCPLLVGRKRKKETEEEQPGGFFSRARHALLAVPHGIFAAVRCN
jgi:hypothetical protein